MREVSSRQVIGTALASKRLRATGIALSPLSSNSNFAVQFVPDPEHLGFGPGDESSDESEDDEVLGNIESTDPRRPINLGSIIRQQQYTSISSALKIAADFIDGYATSAWTRVIFLRHSVTNLEFSCCFGFEGLALRLTVGSTPVAWRNARRHSLRLLDRCAELRVKLFSIIKTS